jgi:hypothetical protein
MIDYPKIKKEIGAFLTKEEGKISKEKLLKTGIILGSIAAGAALSVRSVDAATCTHTNGVTLKQYTLNGGGAFANHNHHCNSATGTGTGTGTGY